MTVREETDQVRTAVDPLEALVAAARGHDEPAARDFEAVSQMLRIWLGRRGLTPEELAVVCSEAVRRLMAAASDGRLDPERPAGAWLRVVADHLAVDILRRRAAASPIEFDERLHSRADEDERLASLLDRDAAGVDVREALRAAVDANEHGVVRVVSTWLGLASANDEAPSTREVAERLGISHMTVQRALRSFGKRLTR